MRNGLEQADGGHDPSSALDEDAVSPFAPPATSLNPPERGRRSWHIAAALCATLTTIVLVWLVPELAGDIGRRAPAARIWLGLIPLHVGAFGAAMIVLRALVPEHERLQALGLTAVPFSGVRSVLGSGALIVGVYGVTAVLTVITGLALRAVGYTPEGSPMAALLVGSDNPWLWASATVSVLVIAPIAEEILFRLVLFEALSHRRGLDAVTATALVFAAIHMIPEAMPGLFLLGIVLQKIRARSNGSLWAPIAAHAGFNAIGLALMVVYHFSTTSTIAS